MNFTQFLSVLRARWWLGLLVAAITTAIGLGYSLRAERTYTASAAVMLDVLSPELTGGFGAVLLPSYLATQVDLIGSERVALRAVDLLNLPTDPAARERWTEATEGAGNFRVWLSQALRQGLELRPSRESNVITVMYSSPDPAYAARAANAFVQAYGEIAIEMRAEPAQQFQQLYREKSDEARVAMESVQAQLSELQRAHGLLGGGGDGRVDLEAARLSELSSQLVQVQALVNESQSRRDEVSRGAERLSEVRGDPAVAQLRVDLVREQSRLLELNQRLGEMHPQVEEQQARLTELRLRLAAAVRTASGSVEIGNNVNRARLSQLQTAIAEQREKVTQLRSVRDQADMLQRDLENARHNYDALRQRLSQTELAGRSTQTNVSVVQSATAPLRPSAPRTLLNTVAALLAGSVLGVCLIVIAELRDRRVRTADEITGEMQQALLLTMPKVHFSDAQRISPIQRSPKGPLSLPAGREGWEAS